MALDFINAENHSVRSQKLWVQEWRWQAQSVFSHLFCHAMQPVMVLGRGGDQLLQGSWAKIAGAAGRSELGQRGGWALADADGLESRQPSPIEFLWKDRFTNFAHSRHSQSSTEDFHPVAHWADLPADLVCSRAYRQKHLASQ